VTAHLPFALFRGSGRAPQGDKDLTWDLGWCAPWDLNPEPTD